MDQLDQLLSLYTRLIGVNGGGDRDLDHDLAAYLAARSGVAVLRDNDEFTGSIDLAVFFLERALPGWQIHELHCGPDPASSHIGDHRLAHLQSRRWYCDICREHHADENAEGYGRTAPVAILSAVITQLISDVLTHWRLTQRDA